MRKINEAVFQAIADPSRRQILHLLGNSHLPINALAENFEMSRPAVSKHIKILETAGFISIETKGRERYCSLNKKGFDELQQWVDYYESFWHSKMQHLGSLLNKMAKAKKHSR